MSQDTQLGQHSHGFPGDMCIDFKGGNEEMLLYAVFCQQGQEGQKAKLYLMWT